MPLNRLLYASRSVSTAEGAARDAEINELATRSASRNAGAHLTGILLHVDDSFVQVLEGPMAAVERTFEAICCDFRHEDVKLIDLVPVKERVFPEWSMAALSAERETEVRLRDDLQEVRYMVGINAREAIREMRRLLDGRTT